MKKIFLLLILAAVNMASKAQNTLPYVDLSFELSTPPSNGSSYVIEFGDSMTINYKITNHGPGDLDTANFILYGGEIVPSGWALVMADSATDGKAYLEPGQHFIGRGIQFSGSDTGSTSDTTYEYCFYLYHDWNDPFYQDTVGQNDTLCFSVTFKKDPNSTSIANKAKAISVEIYPNPTSNQLNIEFSKPLTKAHSLKILNVLGQEVYQTAVAKGANKFIFEAASLSQGNYFLIIEGEDLQLRKNWTKQ